MKPKGEDRAFVYMVKCSDGTLYTGWTTDAGRRVREHNSGRGAKYTRSRRPVTLVYLEKLEGKSPALKREAEIKKLSRRQKMKLITSEENQKDHLLQKNRNSRRAAGRDSQKYLPAVRDSSETL